MENKRRIIQDPQTMKAFVQVRSLPLEELLPYLFIYSIEALLIYDKSKSQLSNYLQSLSGIDTALYSTYFSEYSLFDFSVRELDDWFSYILHYVTQLSSRFYGLLGLNPGVEDLLDYYSRYFQISIHLNYNRKFVSFGQMSQLAIFPLQITIKEEAVYFFYPSLSYAEEIVRSSSGTPELHRSA